MNDELDWTTLPKDLKQALLFYARALGAASSELAKATTHTEDEWFNVIGLIAAETVGNLSDQQIDRLVREFQKGQGKVDLRTFDYES